MSASRLVSPSIGLLLLVLSISAQGGERQEGCRTLLIRGPHWVLPTRPVHLRSRDVAIVCVPAASRRWDTFIAVRPGENYRVMPLPFRTWFDAGIPSGAEGYEPPFYTRWYMNLFRKSKPLHDTRYLALCCSTVPFGDKGLPANVFPVPCETTYTAAAEGRLAFFANDAQMFGGLFYLNNSGLMPVLVTPGHAGLKTVAATTIHRVTHSTHSYQ